MVPHGKSLVKNEKMKISTKSVMWGSERLREEDRVDAERRLSSWREGTRGIPEESILEPILFKILINNLGIKEWSMLMKSADGQKQGGSVNMREDGVITQKGLRTLRDQNNKNSTKCKSQSAPLPSDGQIASDSESETPCDEMNTG